MFQWTISIRSYSSYKICKYDRAVKNIQKSLFNCPSDLGSLNIKNPLRTNRSDRVSSGFVFDSTKMYYSINLQEGSDVKAEMPITISEISRSKDERFYEEQSRKNLEVRKMGIALENYLFENPEELDESSWWIGGDFDDNEEYINKELTPLTFEIDDIALEMAKQIPFQFKEILNSIHSQQQSVIQSDDYYNKRRAGEPIFFDESIYKSLSTLVGLVRNYEDMEQIRVALVHRGIIPIIMELFEPLGCDGVELLITLEAFCVFLPEGEAVINVIKNEKFLPHILKIIENPVNEQALSYATHICCLLTAIDEVVYELNHPKYNLIEALTEILKKDDLSESILNNGAIALVRLCTYAPHQELGMEITKLRLEKAQKRKKLKIAAANEKELSNADQHEKYQSNPEGSSIIEGEKDDNDKKKESRIIKIGSKTNTPSTATTLESLDSAIEYRADLDELKEFGILFNIDSRGGRNDKAIFSSWFDPKILKNLISILRHTKAQPLKNAIICILSMLSKDGSTLELIYEEVTCSYLMELLDEFIETTSSTQKRYKSIDENVIYSYAVPEDILNLFRIIVKNFPKSRHEFMENKINTRLVELVRQNTVPQVKGHACAIIYNFCIHGTIYSQKFVDCDIINLLVRLLNEVPRNSLSNTLQYYYLGLLKFFIKLHSTIHKKIINRYFLTSLLTRCSISKDPILLRYAAEIISIILNGESTDEIRFLLEESKELQELMRILSLEKSEIGQLYYHICMRLGF